MSGLMADSRGRLHRRLTDAEVEALEREDARSRLRDYIAGLRNELGGVGYRESLAADFNLKNPWETPSVPAGAAEIEAEISRAEARLAAI